MFNSSHQLNRAPSRLQKCETTTPSVQLEIWDLGPNLFNRGTKAGHLSVLQMRSGLGCRKNVYGQISKAKLGFPAFPGLARGLAGLLPFSLVHLDPIQKLTLVRNGGSVAKNFTRASRIRTHLSNFCVFVQILDEDTDSCEALYQAQLYSI